MPRRRPVAGVAVAVVAGCLAATSGCDGAKSVRSGSGVPPAPPPSEAASVALILPSRGLAEQDVWEAEARRDEARVHALIEVRKPAPGDPPGRQAELIREAAASGVSALIVVAEDAKLVAPAIAEARDRGLPVVLLDRDVPLPGDGPKPPLVGFEDVNLSAKALVAAAMSDAQAAGFPPGGPALLIHNDVGDDRAPLRIKALRSALEAEGVRVLPDLEVRSDVDDVAVAVGLAKDAQPFIAAAAAGQTATLTVDGRGGRRKAFNVIGRLDRKAAQTVVVSTPRSGWFGCTAERGSGLAVWLSLAHALAASPRKLNVELVCTSGHEYEYLGGEFYLEEKLAPAPATTKLWVHIGASAAARDWHELGPVLRPLPSADPQRVLTATPDIVERVRVAFKGITGLEAVYSDKASAGGELTNVQAAGYATTIGLYGGHRYFHTRGDDLRCTSGELVQPVAAAFHSAVRACLDS